MATLRAACDEVLRLGEQQEKLIDALLTLAISERGIGPVISPAEVARLFRPFQRLGDERVRHGLGSGREHGGGYGIRNFRIIFEIFGTICFDHDCDCLNFVG